MERKLLVGADKAEIKYPDVFFPEEYFTGVQDPISVRAILVECGISFLILSLELPSVKPQSLIEAYREKTGCLLGIPKENVWICMTHNSTGPHVPPAAPQCVHETTEEKKKMHLDALGEAITEAALKAKVNLQEAVLAVGVGESQVNVNRDICSKDGWWNGIEGKGYSDKTLSVLRFDNMEGEPICLIYHYAMKSAVMERAKKPDGTQVVTSEITGRACNYAENVFGVPVMFLMGAAADQVPRKCANYFTVNEDGHLREITDYYDGLNAIDSLGDELGRDVVNVASTIKCCARVPLLDTFTDVYEGKGQVNPRLDVPQTAYEYRPTENQKTLLQFFCIGDLVMVGVKPEISAIIGRQLREQSPAAYTWIVDMVNGGQGYMPDTDSYDRYTYPALKSDFWKGSAEEMRDYIVRILKEKEQNR